MKEVLMQIVEEGFEIKIKKTIANNPMKGTGLEGMAISTVITSMAKSFKETYKAEAHKIKMTPDEIDSAINDVAQKMVNKYLIM